MNRCSGSWRAVSAASIVAGYIQCSHCRTLVEAEHLDLKTVDIYRIPKHERSN